MKNHEQTAYLAPPGFEQLLIDELRDVCEVNGGLVIANGPPQDAKWVQNIWYQPTRLTIHSINDAANALRKIQRNWWPLVLRHHGRVKLIQEKLPYIVPKPIDFLGKVPTASLGSWTLLDEQTLYFAAHCSSPMPHGVWNFNEDKFNPPSRAYLKLWEFFTRFGVYPSKHDLCVDLGACPGGWTYVLAKLAKQVHAIDRSSLDERVLQEKNVSFHAGDAFKVKLSDYPDANWIFSDVVCFPDKLHAFITQLLDDYPDKKYVFTIKFQGDNHREAVPKFASLPGQIVHLSQNKHELTWFKI